jgi:hypothetical protein
MPPIGSSYTHDPSYVFIHLYEDGPEWLGNHSHAKPIKTGSWSPF